jgi:hypothetical protein
VGPFAVCCYSVFKDRIATPHQDLIQTVLSLGNRIAQGDDEETNLIKSKQPVNNFLLPGHSFYCPLLTHPG